MKELLIKNQNKKQLNTQIYNEVIQNTYCKRSTKKYKDEQKNKRLYRHKNHHEPITKFVSNKTKYKSTHLV